MAASRIEGSWAPPPGRLPGPTRGGSVMTARRPGGYSVRRLVLPVVCLFLLMPVILSGPAGAASSVDWPTYGYDTFRTGYNPNETILGSGTVGGLHELWSFDLGAVTIMQPAYAAGVQVHGTPTDVVYIG